MITIAKGLEWNPSQAATQTYAPIGRKGSGKTYAAGKLVEELYGSGCPVVVLDPVGNWGPGLRRSASGKGPGLPIAVLGGDNGDLPLRVEDAAQVAAHIAERNASAVLDLSPFRKGERKRFVGAFAEEFFQTCKRNRSPRMIVFEEAQLFAPQRCGAGEERMLGAVEDIVRLGRNYGIGCCLITQRPQSVNKEVLNQVEVLLVGQLSGAHERRAIQDWIVAKGEDLETHLQDLPSLKVGEFFLWSPQWLGTFQRITVARKKTWDASSTPELGAAVKLGSMVQVDLAELEGALQQEEPATESPKAEPRVELHWQKVAEKVHSELETVRRELVAWVGKVKAAEEALRDLRLSAGEVIELGGAYPPALEQVAKKAIRAAENAAAEAPIRDLSNPGKAERAIVSALARHGGMRRAHLALVSGYRAKSKGFLNALSALRVAGVVAGSAVITLHAVPSGLELEKPLVGEELFQYWWSRSGGKAERSILAVLKDHGSLSKSVLAARCGYDARAKGFLNALSRLRTLELVAGKVTIDLEKEFRKAIG